MKQTIQVPPPKSGGLMLSYKCTAACRHCMYACSQKWESDWMSEEDLTAALTALGKSIIPSPWGSNAIYVWISAGIWSKSGNLRNSVRKPSTGIWNKGRDGLPRFKLHR